MDENSLQKEIESLLNDAENYLMDAKAKKGKDVKNFEAILALEYAIKARDRSKALRDREELYANVNRKVETILGELKKLPLSLQRERSYEERKYDEGDVAGG